MAKTYNEVYKSRMREILEALSGRITRRIAIHYGPKVPFYLVCEYPRSGGSWLSNMLADYLFCARPASSVLPIAMRAVIHNHWKHHPRFRNAIYLLRDGRDVLTSYYFYRMRGLDDPKGSLSEKRLEQWKAHFGEDFDWHDVTRHMPAYIRRELSRPVGAYGLNWAQHVRAWCAHRDDANVMFMKYEELIADPVGQLARAAHHVSQIEPDRRLIERSVEHHAMTRVTGRKQGEEDRSEFVRKGVAGDWLNYFTREAAQVFDELAGDALVLAGYERDRDWIDRYQYQPHAMDATRPAPPPA